MHNIVLIVFAALLMACQSAYYSAAEQLGYDKRDILVDRVTQSRNAQQQAEVQFQSALAQLSELAQFDGGDLEAMYEAMVLENNRCIESAIEVRDRIAAVEHVANALFSEWEDEIEVFTNSRLKSDSQQKLQQTRYRYNAMLAVLERAAAKMDPILAALNDNVLYLKHNLNAAAVSSLQMEFDTIEKDIEALMNDMRAAIASSDAFISSLR